MKYVGLLVYNQFGPVQSSLRCLFVILIYSSLGRRILVAQMLTSIQRDNLYQSLYSQVSDPFFAHSLHGDSRNNHNTAIEHCIFLTTSSLPYSIGILEKLNRCHHESTGGRGGATEAGRHFCPQHQLHPLNNALSENANPSMTSWPSLEKTALRREYLFGEALKYTANVFLSLRVDSDTAWLNDKLSLVLVGSARILLAS